MATVQIQVTWTADSKDEYVKFKDWWAKRPSDGMKFDDDDGNLTVKLTKTDLDWKVPPDEPKPDELV